MEQSAHKRVYINPNFKRTDVEQWPPVPVKTTHFNRHYLEELPNRLANPKTFNNRKIFVNPNFINSNNAQTKPMTSTGCYVQPNENLNAIRARYNENLSATSKGYVQPNKNLNSISMGYGQPNQNLLINSTSTGYYVQPKENLNSISTGYVQPKENLNSISTGYVQPKDNLLVVSTSTGYHVQPKENLNSTNVSNNYLLHKSKYSLVKSIQQTVVTKEPAKIEINKSNAQMTIPESYKNTNKITQEVPVTRTKYCIIRKKKRLSINAENKSINIMATGSAVPGPITPSNQVTCYAHVIQNSVRNKLINNPTEKITKIKITKYKTVPLSYLKENAVNKNKLVPPLKYFLKSGTKLNSSKNLINLTCNKNMYKFIKTNTPIKFNTPVSTVKATSKIAQLKEKGIKSVGAKGKLSKSLRAKFNINNIPCRLFTKYGKCLRQDQGNCKYLHDKKHVSLCRKFLKGICHDEKCTLSHELTDKKMPTCYFYLKGMCTKECCPYLHVKLSDKTKICQEFAKGYCENGDKCLFRHVNIDKIKNKRKISSNKFQRNPQAKTTKTEPQQQGQEKMKSESSDTIKNLEETVQKDDEDCRYYKELANSDDIYEVIKPTRCKLGTLPSFIQLG